MNKPKGRKARKSKTFCKRVIILRTDSLLHSALVMDAENDNISVNTLLVKLLTTLYQKDIDIMSSALWKNAERYINKKVEGMDVISGQKIKGVCFGVDCHVKPMGKRGVFLVVEGPTTLTTYKIDFSTFVQTNDK